jgi:hypothetical protein
MFYLPGMGSGVLISLEKKSSAPSAFYSIYNAYVYILVICSIVALECFLSW